MRNLKYLLISTRPRQWYKNALLLVGLIFSHNLLNTPLLINATLAFIYFCALSAGEYLINDILDRERDRKHRVKCRRPIASGQLKVSHAITAAAILITLALLGAYFTVSPGFFIISLAYLLLMGAYSLWLKHVIIIDVIVIAIGFVMRAIAGCLAVNVFISPWLVICTFLLALFLALGKRRHELAILAGEATPHRVSLSGYSIPMLEHLITTTTAALIVSYFMYTFLTDNYYMLLTTPTVIYGLFRYLMLSHRRNFGGEPEMIFKDKATMINLGIWVLVVILVLYGNLSWNQ
jgi:4-hydroxybenzoate polyprenyltransferase